MYARSSAEAEYCAMALGLTELLWLRLLLQDIGLPIVLLFRLYCDNEATMNIANNPIQLDCTKHVEID